MGAVEAAIAKIFIDIAISTGVDVLSNRAANPVIRGASRTYKVYSLVSTIEGAYSAIRISAYTDAAQLIGQEAVVQVTSKPIVNALLSISAANYEVHQKAERYLLSPEFSDAHATETLGRWLYHNTNFLAENLTRFGQPLASQASACVARAVRARDIAAELVRYAEANVERRYYTSEGDANWIDRLNAQLGHLIWRPVPEIGLGKRVVSDGATYFGIFRRNDPEGYGCIVSPNGTRYLGQSRYGFPKGYGAFYFTDGTVYMGKVPTGDHQLGASISPKRDWVYYGEHSRTTPDGYGRRVGLANGIESVSAFWRDGKLEKPLQTLVEVYRNIAEKMDGPVVQELRTEYENLARDAVRSIATNDGSVLDHLRSDL